MALALALATLAFAGCGGSGSPSTAKAAGATVTVKVPPSRVSTAAATSGGGSAASGRGGANAPGAGGGSATVSGAKSLAPSASTGVPYEVHTISMEPTYRFGAKVYYDPARTHPQIGEVIVFYLPVGGRNSSCGAIMEGQQACAVAKPGLTKILEIKRVVGLPGDTIAIRHGRVIRDGRPEPEPRTLGCGSEAGCEFPAPVTVPAGAYYVMSDNRAYAHEDSRLWGAVPQAAIVGTVEGG